jgi:hypothetical protein
MGETRVSGEYLSQAVVLLFFCYKKEEKPKIIEYLLDSKVDLDAYDDEHRTPVRIYYSLYCLKHNLMFE